jgi:hypothetical protein
MKFRKNVVLGLIAICGLLAGLFQNCGSPDGEGQLQLGSGDYTTTGTVTTGTVTTGPYKL